MFRRKSIPTQPPVSHGKIKLIYDFSNRNTLRFQMS